MSMAISYSERQSYSDINMTPLIDVMLVLLIIFIITIPRQTHSVIIDNPAPNPTAPIVRPEVIDLAIDFDGTVLWNQRPVDRAALQGYIGREAAKNPQPEVHISVDKFARYEVVAQTLADLQYRGLKKIGFINNSDF